MALTFRLIARLDIRNDQLIKTIRCEGVRRVGDPADRARAYDAMAIDEVFYLDVVASLYGRNSLLHLVEQTAEHAFVPLSVGGGIASCDTARQLLQKGADKLACNTAAITRPSLLTDLAQRFGCQAVVLQLDAKQKGQGWEAYCEGARQPTGRDAVSWAQEAVERGAGEVLVTSIDREGTRSGFDLALIERLSASLPVPVIASGGFGEPKHAVEAWRAGASGIAIAGALHYDRVTLEEIRNELAKSGVAVRCASSSPAPMASSAAI